MQKNSGIGGQAVIEGIMMRNGDQYSIAARKENGEIALEKRPYKSIIPGKTVWKIPLIRGMISFIDSLVVGVSSLMWSADQAVEEEEGEGEKPKTAEEQAKEERTWKVMMTGTVIFSVCFSIVLFMLLPFWIAGLLRGAGASNVLVHLVEALLRLGIFLAYMLLISRMKDIQRVFAYHGAEHKCINCIESDLDLTVENVMKSSRQHRRCGTSFLLIVISISIITFLILGLFDIKSRLWRLLWRLILIPVIAGVSYELLRYAGCHEGPVINQLVKPGLALQKLVTREPDEKECEVAIAAVEAVFDWRAWQNKK
jgi:uncharacterized protein YqhQ